MWPGQNKGLPRRPGTCRDGVCVCVCVRWILRLTVDSKEGVLKGQLPQRSLKEQWRLRQTPRSEGSGACEQWDWGGPAGLGWAGFLQGWGRRARVSCDRSRTCSFSLPLIHSVSHSPTDYSQHVPSTWRGARVCAWSSARAPWGGWVTSAVPGLRPLRCQGSGPMPG